MTLEMYTGVKVVNVAKDIIDCFYTEGSLDIELLDGRLKIGKCQNMFVVLKDEIPKEQGGVGSALARVKGNKLLPLSITDKSRIASISPRNKEQIFAFDLLMDESIRIVSLVGNAGTGKTLIALSAALALVEQKKYKRIILTRNMSQVGRASIGFLPGDAQEKFLPFNQGYLCNFERLLGNSGKDMETSMAQLPVEFIPIQLIRGANWPDSLIILDEAQNLNHYETLTLGTRPDEGSKLIMLGDLNQRDERLTKKDTGLYRFVNDSRVIESPGCASIQLIKCERGFIANMFATVFEDKDE